MILGEDGFGEVPFDKNNLRRVCTAITLIFRVILADNHVSPEEMSEAVKLLNVWLEVPELLAQKIIEKALKLDENSINVNRLCRRLCGRTSLTERKQFVEILMTIGNADGDFPESEITKIWEIGRNLQFPESNLAKIREVLNSIETKVV